MAYTALAEMQQKNIEKFGLSAGPKQPQLVYTADEDMNLKTAAIRFLHKRCEGLRFSKTITEQETEGNLKGISTKAGQIPFNMQMDIDRLCLEKAVERFADTGVAEDAFEVYFCYLEMFVGRYGKSRRMIELLSEFEINSSSLLMKHRDHYSHSVYVFLLGLAIYEMNENYRNVYKEKYGLKNEQKAAHHFLQYWGLTALFHDIGYPFELPFEQVCSYFEVGGKERECMPFISYNQMEIYTGLSKKEKDVLTDLYDGQKFNNFNEVFAFEIASKLGETYKKTEAGICKILETKPTNPDQYNYYMDHAYFSAVILIRELIDCMDKTAFTHAHMDAIIAILLHNSLYKFSITNVNKKDVNKPFEIKLHPLAYLLMLCDELQCWDRTSYGRNSRTELHPMACKFSFRNNGIQAVYIYDKAENEKINKFKKAYQEYEEKKRENPDCKDDKPELKAYGNMYNKKFQSEIEAIVDLKKIPLDVSVEYQDADNVGKHTYLSNSNFLHLYDFAVALNAQYNNMEEKEEEMIASFEELSLEYKLSNILQAKEFEEHLDELDYFYTDRPVAYPMVNEFTDEELAVLGSREHKRWESEKCEMCWLPAGELEEVCKDKMIREQLRMHYDLDVTFDNLPYEEKVKDMKPLNTMMKKLKEFDGLRIYSIKK